MSTFNHISLLPQGNVSSRLQREGNTQSVANAKLRRYTLKLSHRPGLKLLNITETMETKKPV